MSYLPFSGSVLGQLADELDGYTMTKSALHFGVDRPLPKALVKKLIRARLAEIESRPLTIRAARTAAALNGRRAAD